MIMLQTPTKKKKLFLLLSRDQIFFVRVISYPIVKKLTILIFEYLFSSFSNVDCVRANKVGANVIYLDGVS